MADRAEGGAPCAVHATPGRRRQRPIASHSAGTSAFSVGRYRSTAVTEAVATMDKIVALCKRRGLIFPASEIYGGIANTYDYGHYGVLLKNNVVNAWWRAMIQERDDIVALDSAIIQHPRTWEASGHLAGFSDPLVQCLGKCKRRLREDHLREEAEARGEDPDELVCPECGGELTEPRAVQPHVRDHDRPGEGGGLDRLPAPRDRPGHLPRLQDHAPVRAQEAAVRDRPDRQVVPQRDHARQLHLPHARVRADGDGVLRAAGRGREVARALDGAAHGVVRRRSASDRDKLRLRPHGPDELSHYSSATSDIEYLYPIGWSELEGIANRGDFDLKQHAEYSGQKLEYVDTATGDRYVPHVIEPAAGLGRTVLTLLCDAYDEDEIGGEQRTVLRLLPADGADQGGGAAAREQGRPAREGARDLRGAAHAHDAPSTTPAARSASATAARTRSARPGGSRSTTRRWRTTR